MHTIEIENKKYKVAEEVAELLKSVSEERDELIKDGVRRVYLSNGIVSKDTMIFFEDKKSNLIIEKGDKVYLTLIVN